MRAAPGGRERSRAQLHPVRPDHRVIPLRGACQHNHLPLRTDLFSRVAWQLRNRAVIPPESLEVYAWLPVLAFKLPDNHPAAADLAAVATGAKTGEPVSGRVRETIQEIYADAGANAPRAFGLLLGTGSASDGSVADAFPRSVAQAEDLDRFVLALAAAFRESHPNALLARMIAPSALLDRGAGERTASRFAALLRQFDFVTLSIPTGELEPSDPWLDKLIDRVARQPAAPAGCPRPAAPSPCPCPGGAGQYAAQGPP